MYNFEELFTPAAASCLDLSSMTDLEFDAMAADEKEASQFYHAAMATLDGLWERLDSVATMGAVTASCAAVDSSITGTGYHMAGVAAHLATKGLPDNVREINAFESNGETFDLVEAGEGFKEIITSVWEAIKKGRDKAWRWLKRMWAKSVGRYARLRRGLTSLKERADDVAASSKTAENSNVEVTSGVQSFFYAGKMYSKAEDLVRLYNDTVTITKFFYGDYLDTLRKQLPRLEKTVADADVSNASAASVSVANNMTTLALAMHVKMKKHFPRDTGAAIKDTKHISSSVAKTDLGLWALLGDAVLVYHQDKVASEKRISAINSTIFGVHQWDTKKNNTDRVNATVATPEQVREFCNIAIEGCDQILVTLDKSSIDKLSDTSTRINKAVAKYKENVARLAEAPSGAEMSTVTSILEATKKVDSWLTGITNQIGSNYASTTSALASYMSKSLSQYK